ncbi:DUF4430 domain-containing protein [Candidatus Parcubacteria bacterium]|jgi:hypothetical protein|nr:DUF4430 domain-containing protein [Candidatus Parcubacteria bacterium]
MKKVLFLIFAISLVFSPGLIKADYSNTIDYLQSQTQNAWTTQALAAANVNNSDVSYIDASTSDLMTAIKSVLALAANNSQDQDVVISLSDTINSNMSAGQLGSADLLNDDFWGLMALKSIGQTDNIDTIKDFILSAQNTDGGWGWSTTAGSDSNDTAAAVMALLDAGFTSSDAQLAAALAYIQTTQNDDGGFGYDVDSDSDGASTAWVIATLNKSNVSPSTWEKNNNNPVLFLESLQQADGSFLWLPSDQQGSAMVTAYALLALSDGTYPVNYIQLNDDQSEVGVDLRIEGPTETICLAADLQASTVLELLETAADACDFEYIAEDTAYGTYVSSIGGVDAQGMEGWQYWVDWQSATVGAADYQLSDGEDVLWAYGQFDIKPSRVEINSTVLDTSESLIVTVQHFDGSDWLAWPSAELHIGSETYHSGDNGQLTITLNNDGVYEVWAEQSSAYIRSNKLYVTVGDGVSNTVDLLVDIESDGSGSGQDAIAFSVSQSNINFGSLKPGQSADTILSLNNTGNVSVYIEASILGDDIFKDNVSLGQSMWEDFNIYLPTTDSNSVNVGLEIPNSFSGSGQKSGQLIFWATNN